MPNERLLDELVRYGKFVFEVELDVNIHQKFYNYNGGGYSVTMKNGVPLVICLVQETYRHDSLFEKEGE